MQKDIVPELYDRILRDYRKYVNENSSIQGFYKKMDNETASSEEAAIYAGELGKCAANALTGNLTEKNLPGGKLYYNIAMRTIKPMLQEVHRMVNEAMCRVMDSENRKAGIGFKSSPAPFPEWRIDRMISEIVNTALGEDKDG